jgi:cell pole-organizing protein PopZ
MADILASIRRIVADESVAGEPEGVLLLTPAMRADTAPSDLEALSSGLDEAVVADIARAVLREELGGQLGEALTARIRAMIRDEVAKAVRTGPV